MADEDLLLLSHGSLGQGWRQTGFAREARLGSFGSSTQPWRIGTPRTRGSRPWARDLRAARAVSFSAWAGLARYEPLDEPELGAFEQLDREALGLHMLKRLAQHVVGAEANERRR